MYVRYVRVRACMRIICERTCVCVSAEIQCVRQGVAGGGERLLIDTRALAVFVWLNARRAKTIGPRKINR